MTAANQTTATPSSAPRPAQAGGALRGGRQQAPTVDPVRILRQHAWLLAGSAGVGLLAAFAAAAALAALHALVCVSLRADQWSDLDAMSKVTRRSMNEQMRDVLDAVLAKWKRTHK
jgi:hypothetical protein